MKKAFALLLIFGCICATAGCGKSTAKTDANTGDPVTMPSDAATPVVEQPVQITANPTPSIIPAETAPNPAAESKEYITKFTNLCDKSGIYAFSATFCDDLLSDEGSIIYRFYNEDNAPADLFCTFRADYTRKSNADGSTYLYDIKTTYNSEIYQNLRDKKSLQISLEFGAFSRASRVEVFVVTDDKEEHIKDFEKYTVE